MQNNLSTGGKSKAKECNQKRSPNPDLTLAEDSDAESVGEIAAPSKATKKRRIADSDDDILASEEQKVDRLSRLLKNKVLRTSMINIYNTKFKVHICQKSISNIDLIRTITEQAIKTIPHV
jgi:uncharacterized protein YceH (UPF0502 family)